MGRRSPRCRSSSKRPWNPVSRNSASWSLPTESAASAITSAAWTARNWRCCALAEGERLAELGRRIRYVVQEHPEGYGHAVYCAREFVGEDPFLLLLGDHVYISGSKKPCSRQVMEVFEAHRAPVSGVQRTGEDLLHLFGALTGRAIGAEPYVYEVTRIKEKPDPEYAEEYLRTTGLRRGEYLCFFGMHVLPPALFELLEHHIRHDVRERGEIQLTGALEMLRQRCRYLAAEVDGNRLDMGVPFGYVQAQLALALNSPARRRVLAALPSLLTLSDLESLR
jgi:UTP--glucose-1-phosphate uridylyltransferase